MSWPSGFIFTLKMELEWSSETLVSYHFTIKYYKTENDDMNNHRENLKYFIPYAHFTKAPQSVLFKYILFPPSETISQPRLNSNSRKTVHTLAELKKTTKNKCRLPGDIRSGDFPNRNQECYQLHSQEQCFVTPYRH
jgi:hypothetical protein